MRYAFGTIFILAGIAQIVFRSRTARANAAANSVMFNGHMSGKGWIRYNSTMAAIIGSIFVVLGILMASGVLGPIH